MIVYLVSTCALALPMPMEEGYKYPEPEIPFTLPPRRTTTTTTTTKAPTTGYKYPVRLCFVNYDYSRILMLTPPGGWLVRMQHRKWRETEQQLIR